METTRTSASPEAFSNRGIDQHSSVSSPFQVSPIHQGRDPLPFFQEKDPHFFFPQRGCRFHSSRTAGSNPGLQLGRRSRLERLDRRSMLLRFGDHRGASAGRALAAKGQITDGRDVRCAGASRGTRPGSAESVPPDSAPRSVTVSKRGWVRSPCRCSRCVQSISIPRLSSFRTMCHPSTRSTPVSSRLSLRIKWS